MQGQQGVIRQASCTRKIEIFISCRTLVDKDTFSKSDPFCSFFMKNPVNNSYGLVGKTETIKDQLNPNFVKSFKVDYHFETKQQCKFEVRDDDGKGDSELVGQIETTLGDIVGAKNNVLVLSLVDKHGKVTKGKIILRTEGVEDNNDDVYMKWVGKKLLDVDFLSKSDPFLRFSRNRGESAQDLVTVHETEVIMDNLNPVWKPFELSVQKLCNGDLLRQIKLECWDWEKSLKFQFIGETSFTVQELIQGKREFQLKNPKKNKPTGTLVLEQFNYVQKPSFLQYIQGGLQLNLILAVDFTGSNGVPSQPNSLHYINPQGYPNEYQSAISTIGEILMAYDYDKNIPCFGFGAQTNYPQMKSSQVLHCFPMTGNPQQTEVNGVAGLLQVYQYAIQNVSLSGPTYFNPLLQETIKIASYHKSQGSTAYQILLILTDGEIHDMQQTVDSLVQGSELPLSVIIVGVGKADFDKMEVLDGDKGLVDSKGRKSTRDLCQFVPYRQVSGNATLLAQHVLAEVPDQVVKYYYQQGIKPQPKPYVDMNQSFTNY